MPSTKVREIAVMLKTIHASEDIVAARQKAVQVKTRWRPRLKPTIVDERTPQKTSGETRR